MIQGHLFLEKIDAVHQDQHRLLFMGAQGVIEKVVTTAPTITTLPVGFIQFANIGGTRRLYVNLADKIYYCNLTAA
jgi:hypothetical protein